MEALQKTNDDLNEGLAKEIKELGLRIKAELASVHGEYMDEVSLLNQISGAYF